MKKIIIDPLTRISGLLKIEVEVENNKIVEARSTGSQFRGFENILQGRNPFDAIRIVPRVCGICSTSHAIASVYAMEEAFNVKPDFNGVVVRDIVHGFELLQNHLRTTYFFAFPDFVDIQGPNPLSKGGSDTELDYRLPEDLTKKINSDYLEAIKYSREAHRAIAVLAGKAPHCHGVWIGGITTNIDIFKVDQIRYIATSIKDFITNKLVEDINIIAKYYSEYFNIGKGYGNLMDFGLYENYPDSIKGSKPAVIINENKEKLDINNIKEDLSSSYLNISNDEVIPGISEIPVPDAEKLGAYSWVTSPRYKGYAVEGGPLARMIINGYYNNKISMMDRAMARVLESEIIINNILELLILVKLGSPAQQPWSIPKEGKGIGLTAAARGNLAHFVNIKDYKISNYTLIPPSTWNFSPKDKKGVRGPVEEALVGVEINDMNNPVEIGRIVRSFDPCLNCAAHVVSDRYEPMEINIV